MLDNPKFENVIKMYVYEEMVNGRKLTEIINNDHENVKYLPGHKLPENIVAVPDVVETAKDADIIIFVLPHQFMTNTCKPLIGKVKPDAFGVSLCKVDDFQIIPFSNNRKHTRKTKLEVSKFKEFGKVYIFFWL